MVVMFSLSPHFASTTLLKDAKSILRWLLNKSFTLTNNGCFYLLIAGFERGGDGGQFVMSLEGFALDTAKSSCADVLR